MIFSSLLFMFVFLPVVLVVYYLVPRQFRNLVLFVFSLVFYAWGEPVYILLMLFTAFIDYFNGAMVDKFRHRPMIAKGFVIESVIVNLSLLGFFKYAGLFTSTFNSLTGLGIPVPEVALPIGISFYTFESMSYTIDIYRDRSPRQHSIINYGAYVSFFPHLVAGPIVRYEDMALQLTNRKESLQKFTAGAQRFLVGLFKKVIIANNVAALADKVEYLGSPSTLTAWLGILAFTFQIYFDFSGYSDMAIGLGRMLGFRFNENFDYPYLAASVTEFWRRWHMSLTSWFREYLYIPLGGNRGGIAKTLRNLLIVWFCTGFWHGASWNFILWGFYFALWLILEKYVLRDLLARTPAAVKHLYTLAVVFVGWGLFAMEDLSVCGRYLAACFGAAPAWSAVDGYTLRSYAVTFLLLVVASTNWGARTWARIPDRARRILAPVLMALSLVVCTAYLVDGSYNPFLYFRF